jgi:hypothetical protein
MHKVMEPSRLARVRHDSGPVYAPVGFVAVHFRAPLGRDPVGSTTLRAAVPYSAISTGREGPASGRSSIMIIQRVAQAISAAAAPKT